MDVRSAALRTLINRYYASDIVAMASSITGDDFINVDKLLQLQEEEMYSVQV